MVVWAERRRGEAGLTLVLDHVPQLSSHGQPEQAVKGQRQDGISESLSARPSRSTRQRDPAGDLRGQVYEGFHKRDTDESGLT